MEIDLSAKTVTPEPSAEPTKCSLPAVQSKPGLPTKGGPILNDFIPSFAQMRLPRLNIVQASSDDLKSQFDEGAVVYKRSVVLFEHELKTKDGKTVIHPATLPFEAVILGLLPIRYAEKVPGGGKGLLVNTPKEVANAGGTLDYQEWKAKEAAGMKYFEELAEFVMLIKQPEHLKADVSNFIFDIDGALYGIGIFAMKGSAFNNCAKGLFADRRMGCTYRGGYPSFSYKVSTYLKPFKNGKTAWVPLCIGYQPTSASFQKFSIELVNGAQAPMDPGFTGDEDCSD